MTKLYLFLIVLFSAASLNANPSESTIRYGTSTYTFIKNKHYTWHQAKLKAEELGGHLAVLTSQEENDVVFNKLKLQNQNVWLGATDEGSEGRWRWITGEKWDFANWGGHGNDNANGVEHYLHFHSAFRGQWNDHPPTHAQISGFILEVPIKSIKIQNTYKLRRSIPSGFSMLHIPFSYHNNTVTDIFGAAPDFVLYEYKNNKWIINSYDPDFEEWDYPSHFLPAGTAVWILNNSFRAKTIEFTGDIPKDWRKVITASNP